MDLKNSCFWKIPEKKFWAIAFKYSAKNDDSEFGTFYKALYEIYNKKF